MDSTIVTDLVRYGHLLAVALGLGSAALADVSAITGMARRSGPEFEAILHLCHRLIWPALIAMWLSGLALIYIRTGFQITQFSPKLFAKLLVVTILTVNAHAIGRIAMPLMGTGKGISSLTRAEMRACAVMGGVSSASWLLALAMGSSRYLAQAPWPVFVLLLPLAYVAAILVARLVLMFLNPRPVAPITPVSRLDPAPLVTPDRDRAIKVRTYRIGMAPKRPSRT